MNLYEAAFGLTRGFIHEGGDYGEMVTGETKLAFAAKELIAKTSKDFGVADPLKPVFEIAFETNDVERTLKIAVEAGAVSQKEPTQMPCGQTVSFVSDPDLFCFKDVHPLQALLGPDRVSALLISHQRSLFHRKGRKPAVRAQKVCLSRPHIVSTLQT